MRDARTHWASVTRTGRDLQRERIVSPARGGKWSRRKAFPQGMPFCINHFVLVEAALWKIFGPPRLHRR